MQALMCSGYQPAGGALAAAVDLRLRKPTELENAVRALMTHADRTATSTEEAVVAGDDRSTLGGGSAGDAQLPTGSARTGAVPKQLLLAWRGPPAPLQSWRSEGSEDFLRTSACSTCRTCDCDSDSSAIASWMMTGAASAKRWPLCVLGSPLEGAHEPDTEAVAAIAAAPIGDDVGVTFRRYVQTQQLPPATSCLGSIDELPDGRRTEDEDDEEEEQQEQPGTRTVGAVQPVRSTALHDDACFISRVHAHKHNLRGPTADEDEAAAAALRDASKRLFAMAPVGKPHRAAATKERMASCNGNRGSSCSVDSQLPMAMAKPDQQCHMVDLINSEPRACIPKDTAMAPLKLVHRTRRCGHAPVQQGRCSAGRADWTLSSCAAVSQSSRHLSKWCGAAARSTGFQRRVSFLSKAAEQAEHDDASLMALNGSVSSFESSIPCVGRSSALGSEGSAVFERSCSETEAAIAVVRAAQRPLAPCGFQREEVVSWLHRLRLGLLPHEEGAPLLRNPLRNGTLLTGRVHACADAGCCRRCC